jgi:preprotein translocase subunit SecG
MGFIVGLLTVFLVLDCVVLIFLVLIQLPKKESGAGLAFGAGASDALFGAGSGTVLTKVTKWAAAIFFVMAFLLAVIQKHRSTSSTSEFQKELANPTESTIPSRPSTAPENLKDTKPPGTMAPAVPSATNLLSAPVPATNPPAK